MMLENESNVLKLYGSVIGPLHDLVTWHGINYAGMQISQWAFQNKGARTSPAQLSFLLEFPLCYLRPSIIYSRPCDWILQRTYRTLAKVGNHRYHRLVDNVIC